MTSIGPDRRQLNPLRQTVEIRRVRALADVDLDGGGDGFVVSPFLQCSALTFEAGPDGGRAVFTDTPLDGDADPLERLIGLASSTEYRIGDQIRVWVEPYDDPEFGLDTADERGLLLFDGFIERLPFRIGRTGGNQARDVEDVQIFALASPAVMQLHPDHLVRGRWLYDQAADDGSLVELETPTAAGAACFNFRGRPNRETRSGRRLQLAGSDPAAYAWPFTHDHDLSGGYWTAATAILSLIAAKLYGVDGDALARTVCVEPDTLTALQATSEPADSGGRWQGFYSQLPEVDVTGLRVLDAIAAVADAAGFDFVLEPPMTAGEQDAADRPYVLALYRRQVGRRITGLRLPKKGQFPTTAAATLRAATFEQLQGQRNGAAIVNEVYAVGRQYAEVTVALKPLWSPDDIASDALDASMQADGTSTYHQRHVIGGASYASYAHVGRLWGLDCTGDYVSAFYSSGAYQHTSGGVDWQTLLGIDGDDAISAARAALGVDDPIVLTKRLRHALPLERAEAQSTGVRYVLEASENGGDNWSVVPLRCVTLDGFFGIRLSDIRNLAKISIATLGDEDPAPDIEDSWWGLIKSGTDLRLRLTCRIELDCAARYDALRQFSSGTLHRRAKFEPLDVAETWVQPGSFYASGGSWERNGADAMAIAQAIAQRKRDAHETARLSASVSHWLMRPDQWRIGTGISAIVGRGLVFATDGGDGLRVPVIVRSRMILTEPQSIVVDLTDDHARRGY